MKLIVAVDKYFGIGKNGGLLTYLPEDLKRFKALTLGNILIMGRKTIDSLPGKRLLPNRETWILSRDAEYSKEGALVFESVEAILSYIKEKAINEERIFVAGGATIYEAFLPYCHAALVTKIDFDFEADVKMINLDNHPDFYLSHVDAPLYKGSMQYTYAKYEKKVSN